MAEWNDFAVWAFLPRAARTCDMALCCNADLAAPSEYSASNNLLAVRGGKGTIQLYNLDTENPAISIDPAAAQKMYSKVPLITVASLADSRKSLVDFGPASASVEQADFSRRLLPYVLFPDGKILATTDANAGRNLPWNLLLWDTASGKLLNRVKLAGREDFRFEQGLCFSSDGQQLSSFRPFHWGDRVIFSFNTGGWFSSLFTNWQLDFGTPECPAWQDFVAAPIHVWDFAELEKHR